MATRLSIASASTPCDAASDAWPYRLICIECSSTYEVSLYRVVCNCGGAFDLIRSGAGGDLAAIDDPPGVLPCRAEDLARAAMTSGSATPLVAALNADGGPAIWFKCDQVLPSGSFKDRGTVILAALALQHGARRIVLDSSGNAGASMAMHAARLGIPCDVFVPASTSTGKLRQITALGGVLHRVEGVRERALDAAIDAALAPGTLYASHALNPHFLHGVKTWAYEVVSQLGDAPDAVYLPYGSGSLVLGADLGFRELLASGRIGHMPRIHAVRVAVQEGGGVKVAEGVATTNPWRRSQIKSVIRASRGSLLEVDADAVLRAQSDLAHRGFFVETTGAVAWAGALSAASSPGRVVVALTGTGLKESQ